MPTAFEDFNRSNGKTEDYVTTEIRVKRLKYKHFEKLQAIPSNRQMQYAISTLTGLSQGDIGELDADDAAEITKVIYGFMTKFMKLAGQMAADSGGSIKAGR